MTINRRTIFGFWPLALLSSAVSKEPPKMVHTVSIELDETQLKAVIDRMIEEELIVCWPNAVSGPPRTMCLCASKTLIIGDVEITIRKEGHFRIISARDRRNGAAGDPVKMTAEQCNTFGDVLKIMATT